MTHFCLARKSIFREEMKLLLFTVFIAIAYGSPVNVDVCEFGESFWCSSLKNAKQCGAFQHCLTTVWKNQKLEKDTEDVCTYCENIVADTRKFLTDNDTVAKIKNFLDSSCDLIPISQLADECKSYVDNDFDEVIQIIKSELDPQMVCATVGLCSGLKDKAHHKTLPLQSSILVHGAPVKTDECEQGESYWCSSLKNAKQCGAFQHCFTTVWKNQKLEKDTEDVCTFCENIIAETRKFLGGNDTVARVKNYLESSCKLIPITEVADQCKFYVDNYISEIVQILNSTLDPQKYCAIVGLCRGFNNQVHPVTQTKAKQDLLHHVKLQKTNSVLSVSKVQSNGDICADCKAFMTDVQQQITSQAQEKQIEQLIENELCSQLGTMKDECDQLVEQYTPELMELLASQVDPEMICSSMGVCPAGDKSLLAKLKLQKSPLYIAARSRKVVAGTEECTFCHAIVQEVQSLDRSTTVQQEIESFIKQNLCSKLGSLQNECTTTVDNYGAIIFELLANELDPDTVCKSLGLCTTDVTVDKTLMSAMRQAMPSQKEIKSEIKKVSVSVSCVLCEFIMKELDEMLENNSTTEEIEEALKKVCSILPDTIKGECTSFVELYGPAVIKLLEAELDPTQVCTMIGLCSSQDTKLVHKPQVENDEVCGVCETVVQYVDTLIQENATQAEIEAAVEKVCNFLPSSIKVQCDDLIKQYGPMLIKLLVQELTPEQVCQEIGLCPKASVPMMKLMPIKPEIEPLLGKNECTYGPSYWCASMENAVKCKAVDHCKNKVW